MRASRWASSTGVSSRIRANRGLSDASVKELLRDFLAPIAEGVVDVNEELMDTFPRDRLSVLSIHQSKGLEFPITIVDVGSDFKDLRAPSFKRFPTSGKPSASDGGPAATTFTTGRAGKVPEQTRLRRSLPPVLRRIQPSAGRPSAW